MDTKQTTRQTTQEDKKGEEEMTNKFMFFENFKETADKLPDDLRLKFYDAMTDYVFKGVEPDDVIISALVSAINPVLIEEKRGGARENSGRKSKEIKINQNNQIENFEKTENQNNQIDLQKETKKSTPLNPLKENNKNIYTPITPSGVIAPKGDDTQLDLEEAIARTKRFTKPTIAEIETYCQEKGKSVDAERFWNFYESKGWKVGKNPMKDWKAAVCNWAKDSKPAPVVQEDYVPRVDAEKVKQMASIAEMTRQRMMANAQRKYGA